RSSDLFDRRGQRPAELLRSAQVMLLQVVGHAPGRTQTHARQAAQGLYERGERFGLGQRRLHQNGSFIPGGMGMPAVTDDIFSCEVASALRGASLKAAATRSSSMSLSSASRLGSMVTRLTSCRQLMDTLTRPPPEAPSTMISARASCAFFMFSCIC